MLTRLLFNPHMLVGVALMHAGVISRRRRRAAAPPGVPGEFFANTYFGDYFGNNYFR